MEELTKINFSLKNLFLPLTTKKAVILIIIVSFIVYSNMLFNGFVWDDNAYIINNPDVHSINLSSLIRANVFNHDGQYRPIPAIYFAIMYALSNHTSLFYHIIQLSLHIVNVVLVFFVLKKFLRPNLSFILSLLFLIHPIQVESVSFIASSFNPLFFLFGIVALLLSLNTNISWMRFISVFCLLLLSLLTKETGVLFIFTILLYKLLFDRTQLARFFTFGLITIFIYLVIRIGIGGTYFTSVQTILVPIARLPFPLRLFNIPQIIFHYLTIFLYPNYLAIDQQWTITHINFETFYLPLFIDLLFFLTLGVIGFYCYKVNKKKGKIYVFFLLWFLAGLIMHLQLFPLDMTVADRWFYFPMMGLAGLIGSSLTLLSSRFKRYTTTGYVLIAIILVALSARTMIRNSNWVDEVTLYSHDTRIESNFNTENNLGVALLFQNRNQEGLAHFKRSTQLFAYQTNLYNLGVAYEQTGQFQKAKEYYVKAINNRIIRSGTEVLLLYSYRGLIKRLIVEKDYNTANPLIKKALKLYPLDEPLWGYLAISEYNLHNQKEAIAAAEKAVSISPNDQSYILLNLIKTKQQIILPQ